MRNGNWGYLPDYSSQNHTLKFHRRSTFKTSRSQTHYVTADLNRIPKPAYVVAIFALASIVLCALI